MRRAVVLGLGLGVLACKGASEDVEPATPEPAAERSTAAPALVEVEPPPPALTETEAALDEQPNAELATFTPATRGSGACEVTVSALLEAEEYRGGGPMTPALEASLAADPDYARMYNAESHGDHHIQCHYRVELAHQPGKHYRWRTWFSNTLRDKTPAACNGMAAEVAEDIIRTTRDCTDFAAGAYWGHTLDPA